MSKPLLDQTIVNTGMHILLNAGAEPPNMFSSIHRQDMVYLPELSKLNCEIDTTI